MKLVLSYIAPVTVPSSLMNYVISGSGCVAAAAPSESLTTGGTTTVA